MPWAILSGLLLTAAFPNADFSILAWGALVPLLYAVRNRPAAARFRLGMVAGMAHYLTLMYWLAYTMRSFGGLPWTVSIGLLVLLAAYMSLYIGAFAALLGRIAPSPLKCLLGVPILWTALEFLRAYLITGFPWELLGYTQHRVLPVLQTADLFGVYGISFLIALVNGSLFLGWLWIRKDAWQGAPVGRKTATRALGAALALLTLVALYGAWRLQDVTRDMGLAKTVRTSVLQGNIPQDVKWDEAFEQRTIDTYLNLSREAEKNSPELIVWPETAVPFYFLRDVEETQTVLAGLAGIRADALIGSPSAEKIGGRFHYYNSAYLITSEGTVLGKYDKAHLVPFGEYVPLQQFLPFVTKLAEGVGDFSAGEKGAAVPWKDRRLGIQICYEMVFPALSRGAIKNGADLLVNITNDAWYGRTPAPHQLFSMAVFRAVENRRAVIRAANTGISGFIDPAGRIMARTPLFTEATLTRDVPVLSTQSLYTRWGDILPEACLLITLWFTMKTFLTTSIRKKENTPCPTN